MFLEAREVFDFFNGTWFYLYLLVSCNRVINIYLSGHATVVSMSSLCALSNMILYVDISDVLQIVGISADPHNAENWDEEFDFDMAGSNPLGNNHYHKFPQMLIFIRKTSSHGLA